MFLIVNTNDGIKTGCVLSNLAIFTICGWERVESRSDRKYNEMSIKGLAHSNTVSGGDQSVSV